MAGHQPKKLTELAIASFTAKMLNEALQLRKWMEVDGSIDEASKICSKIKNFFHGTRLLSGFTNEITKQLLTKLHMFSVFYRSHRMNYFRLSLLPLVDAFMHPDVTSIELGPDYLYDYGDDYYNFIMTMILIQIGNLHHLETLSVGLGMNIYLEGIKLVFPAQLKELTVCGTLCLHNDNLKSIVECCRELKSLKIVRCRIADTSVPDILKLNHLETLHLLGEDGYGLDAVCKALINGISTDMTSDVLSATTLKSFGIELKDENTLHLMVDKLPHLTGIVLHLPCELDLSCLTQLKNLRSLTLNAGGRASDDYKKILPVLGKILVSLDLRCYDTLDLEFIGETCSKLRCLHVNTTSDLEPDALPNPSFETYPNFRTVECLKIKTFEDYRWIEFLVAQCLNIKVLNVVSCFPPNITNIVKCTSLTSLEEIHWYPPKRIDGSYLEELCLKFPNLRLVHGLGSDNFISGRIVFNFSGCRKSCCKIYGHSLDILDECQDYESEVDD